MKFNPKHDVNIFTLVDELITRINKTAEENNLQKLYDIRIKDGTYKGNVRLKEGKKPKPFKSIVFTVSDIDTREQIVLFTADYVIKNGSDLLTSNYKKALYKELLYSVLITFGITAENTVKQQRVEKSLKVRQELEHPVSPKEAYSPKESKTNEVR